VIKNPGNYPCVFLNFCKYNYPGEKGEKKSIEKIRRRRISEKKKRD